MKKEQLINWIKNVITKMDKVSIIIPVYNTEKYLVECIESALNQTYKDIEVIAVNDGSTDNSLQILNKYADRIKIISKPNGGAASALNVGIKLATGEWIKRLDSDDILYPNAVEVLIQETKKNSNKTNTILYANWEIMNFKGKKIGVHLESNYNNLTEFDFNVILLDHNIGNEDTALVHKSTFDKYGYFDGNHGLEDYEFRLRCCLLRHCRMRLVPIIIAKYRIHQRQISWTRFEKVSDLNQKAISQITLDKLEPKARREYELALINYIKSKPIILKFLSFIRFRILPYLPRPLFLAITKLYWSMKR